MAMTADEVLKLAKDKEVKFVDFRFTDTRGKEQHVQVPIKYFTKENRSVIYMLPEAMRAPAAAPAGK